MKWRFIGSTRRLEREHNALAWTAWHVVALGRQKKLPKLEKLFVKQPRRRQTWQEQLRVMDMWVVATKRQEQQQQQRGKKPKG